MEEKQDAMNHGIYRKGDVKGKDGIIKKNQKKR